MLLQTNSEKLDMEMFSDKRTFQLIKLIRKLESGMDRLKSISKWSLILLLPIGILLTNIAQSSPAFIEKYYSNGIYHYISQFLSNITGIIPISIAELLIIFLIALFIYKLVRIIITLIKTKNKKRYILIDFLRKILIFISVGYFIFVLIWGLNYYRLPFSEIANLNVQDATIQELTGLCESLITEANDLRNQVQEDDNSVMYVPKGYNDIFNRAHKGYDNIADKYKELGGNYGAPKGVVFSQVMSYSGITGIYFPFTAEANVNKDRTHVLLPATACHEIAHQRGFAREDEANYIAYLTCIAHPDLDFQYSGTILALIHSMNKLYQHDTNAYYTLKATFSQGVLRDLQDNNKFWQKYSGPIDKASTKINNTYLKLNKQQDGVQSYGRMVDLLIAEYRLNYNK
ncbi:DUF3810 domain-containing protein [Vallitalea sp.]|jgi:hypothetical protein|uniref:DUF3810 domain-containing protein n=1 Tax=Vallitalea sp. TaxID=1882829 RepID=UPI0025DCDB37|nr:DUF3810 domain-containing protein [Vallitalea sp.]MCT4687901.1 DUF3810 domain-containing protein [Vallitalea sp.]